MISRKICLRKENNGFPSPVSTGRISGSLLTSKTSHLPRGVGDYCRCGCLVCFGSRFGGTGWMNTAFQ